MTIPTKITSRHWVFLVILLAVALPLLFNLTLPHTPSPETRQVFANIDSLPPGSVLLVSFDFEASTFAEIQPLTVALLRHAFARNQRIIALSLFAEGTVLGAQTLEQIASEYDRHYGDDYVYLGFRPQYIAAILALGESIVAEFPRDYHDNATAALPLTAETSNYSDITLVISIADGSMPLYWVEYAVTPHNVRLQAAVTATMATSFYPYLTSGQIVGLISGLRGAAEYERLLETEGGGARGLFAQSVSQIVLVLIILVGNLAERWRRRK